MVYSTGLLQPGLFENLFNYLWSDVSGVVGDCDLTRFGWMSILAMRTFCIFILPSISQNDFFYFPESHAVTSS